MADSQTPNIAAQPASTAQPAAPAAQVHSSAAATATPAAAGPPTGAAAATATDESVSKVIVAVHGIGEQLQFATIQAVANRFCMVYGEPAGVPLGNFHGHQPAWQFESTRNKPAELRGVAFAEVYWATTPRHLVEQRYMLEEAKRWAGTIVDRLRLRQESCPVLARCHRADFERLQQVLTELIQTVGVLERLSALAARAGLFNFSLKRLLDDYLADVQVVVEFAAERRKIVNAFIEQMRAAHTAYPNANLFVVAHSEGTVVALLALLEALSDPAQHDWISRVRGLMTLGSPLDKHLRLWPQLFELACPKADPARAAAALPAPGAIRWRNYYDHGDPIGFELDDLRSWLATERPAISAVFEFRTPRPTGEPLDPDNPDNVSDDIGFTRYLFPGKAHVDYWGDNDVFGHFIRDVIDRTSAPAAAVARAAAAPAVPAANTAGTVAAGSGAHVMAGVARRSASSAAAAPALARSAAPPFPNRTLALLTSYFAPYAVVIGLVMLAVYVLFKAHLERFGALGAVYPVQYLLANVGGLSLIVMGVTLAARVPAITERPMWHPWCWRAVRMRAAAWLGLAVGLVLGRDVLTGHRWAGAPTQALVPDAAHFVWTWQGALLAVAIVLATRAMFRLRPAWALRTLMLMGAGVMLWLLQAAYFWGDDSTVAPAGGLWPVVLGTVAFIYLWWLATLLFDLVFVWHVQIRRSNVTKRLSRLLGKAPPKRPWQDRIEAVLQPTTHRLEQSRAAQTIQRAAARTAQVGRQLAARSRWH